MNIETALSELLVRQIFGLTSAEGAHLAFISPLDVSWLRGVEFPFCDLPVVPILHGLAGYPLNWFHFHEIFTEL